MTRALGPARLAYWAEAFNRAARRDPDASVALYALGNPHLLRAATEEVVAKLDAWGLLSADTVCLDIGCGTGRFELALAPRVQHIVGVDVAPL
jgi:ubiquinone/menaquinone biosynthesis C-methylase UbiE